MAEVSPFGKFWALVSLPEASLSIRRKQVQRSRGPQQPHGLQCALHIPSILGVTSSCASRDGTGLWLGCPMLGYHVPMLF